MIYLQLIWVYLKIGLLGFGGGYAMLPLIQEEVVDHYHWLTMQEFTDIVAISQVTPVRSGSIALLILAIPSPEEMCSAQSQPHWR